MNVSLSGHQPLNIVVIWLVHLLLTLATLINSFVLPCLPQPLYVGVPTLDRAIQVIS
jgi:hypothetical protein